MVLLRHLALHEGVVVLHCDRFDQKSLATSDVAEPCLPAIDGFVVDVPLVSQIRHSLRDANKREGLSNLDARDDWSEKDPEATPQGSDGARPRLLESRIIRDACKANVRFIFR